MKKFTHLMFILILLFSLRLFFSCCDSKSIKYEWNNINILATNNATNKTDSILWDNVDIILSLDFKQMGKGFNIGFTNCIAKDCDDSYHTENAIQDIKIFTLYDFDDSRLAGSEITDYFYIKSNPQDPQMNY